jgi:hypothetical protein
MSPTASLSNAWLEVYQGIMSWETETSDLDSAAGAAEPITRARGFIASPEIKGNAPTSTTGTFSYGNVVGSAAVARQTQQAGAAPPLEAVPACVSAG